MECVSGFGTGACEVMGSHNARLQELSAFATNLSQCLNQLDSKLVDSEVGGTLASSDSSFCLAVGRTI